MRKVAGRWLVFLPSILLVTAAANGQKAAEESDAFFKTPKVYNLELVLEKKEYEALQRAPRKYAKATLKEGDKILGRDIGVHLKGAAGSYRNLDDKPGLTLNMDKFVKEQRFNGMDKFHLSNSVQDPSYLSELICGEIFRAAGVPASRISHALVTINGKKKGLYYIKEGYDKYFLKRHFGTNDGNFYDGGFLKDLDQPLQLISGKDDVKPQTDLKALWEAAHEKNPKDRYEKMEKLLEIDKFISYLVLEVITWDWDGYPMNRNNYRLYHDPKTNKITFIPSGMDQMFGDPRGPIIPNIQGFISRALLETPQGKEKYFAKMSEIMQKVFNTEALLKRLDELEKVVQPALASIDANAGKDYKNQVNRLRDAVKVRPKNIEEQLSKMKK